MSNTPRIWFSITALCLAAGTAVHTAAFPRAASLIGEAHLPGHLPAVLKGLWLGNSVMVLGLAAFFGCLAVQPGMVARPIAVLMTVMMFILAGLVYVFVGNFPPGHILLLAGVAAAAGCITQEDRPGLATGPA
jgi:hypothetical protein